LAECRCIYVACFDAPTLTVFTPIGMSRLNRTIPSAVLTEQRCHILEVGLAPIVGVFWEHHHICVLVGEELPAVAQTLHRGGNHMNHPTRLGTDKPVSVPAISRFVSIPMRVSVGVSHAAGWVATE
jgi:hypothetical protein